MPITRQAVILVGGLGTRLGSLTNNTPKPLLKVGEFAFLSYLIDTLARHGFNDILLLAGFQGDAVSAFAESRSRSGLGVRCVVENMPLGTGGALRNARNYLADDFILLNGDTLFDINLNDLAVPPLLDAFARMALRRVGETDNGMENWLHEQGYVKESYWRDGEKLAYFGTCDNFLAPYLDGGEKRVSVNCDEEEKWVMVDGDGEYICDQTGGVPTDDSGDYFECEDCGDRTAEDDGYWVGRGDDTRVCESCQENNYRYAYGRRGHQYYVHEDNVIYVDSQSEYYDVDYLDDNEIVELNNGDYAPLDEAIEVDGDWYHVDDDRICRTEDTDEFLRINDGCWQCEESGNWYTDSVDFVEVNGDKYHPDYAPATDDEDEDGDTAVAVAPVVTKPEATMLTMEMLSEVALVEDYTVAGSFVRFGMTILHDGVQLFAHRDVPAYHIQTFGFDQTRIDMRKIISTELMHMASINANLKLESTDTI